MKKIVAIIGPSGSGKTYLSKELIAKGIPKCVTTTTRSPRISDGEVEGKDYYFVKPSQFAQMAFVETTTYHHHQYGLSVDEINRQIRKSKVIQVVVDKNGGRALKKQYPNETVIVYLPITKEKMRERMQKRGDSEQAIIDRLAYAERTQELLPPDSVDYIYHPGMLEALLAYIYEEK